MIASIIALLVILVVAVCAGLWVLHEMDIAECEPEDKKQ